VDALTIGVALAAAGPASAGGAAGEVVEGVLTDPGVECPQFMIDTGEQVSLTGVVPQSAGKYRLTGRWARFSYCMQGRSFDVLSHDLLTTTGD
jgi:hypothetical protein